MNEENFAEMFENSLVEMDRLEPGQKVKAEIVSIYGENIFLQLSGKSEGLLDAAELKDKEGNLTVQEGETIEAYFLKAKGGELHFTTRISGDEVDDSIMGNAFKSGIPVEGVVDKEIKGGFQVKIGSTRAFCPFSQMGKRRVENAADFVGRHMTFKILEYKEGGRNILVSNRAILEEEQAKVTTEMKKNLKEKMVVTGTVKMVKDFGAFVDLGGVQALLPISEISRARVEDINQVFSEGDEVEAVIIKLDWANERITLSRKALEADPWTTAKEKYPAGSRQKGKVVRLTNFGAFINLEPGLDGLIHVSEMKTDDRRPNPSDLMKKDEELYVEIVSVDPKSKRIALKPVAEELQDEATQKYLEPDSEIGTYNPFADLLKKKK